MADDFTVNLNTTAGAVFASDEVSGKHYPFTKIAYGADDLVVKVADGNPFPVQMRTDAGAAMLGSAAEAASLPVVIASDQDFIKAEDAVHGSGDKGIMALAVRVDAGTASAADGDYSALQVNSLGSLYTHITGLVPGVTNTSLGKAEDAVHGTGDTGVMALAVRNDAGAALAADGDYHSLMVNSAGALYVTGGGGGTEYTEDAVAAADPVGGAILMVREDAPVSIAADGDNVALRATEYGSAYVQIVSSTGTFIDTFGGGTEYTEDAVAAADPVGGAILMVREDSPVSIAADGDNVALRSTEYGAAYAQIVTSAGAFVDTFGGGTEYTQDAAHADPATASTLLVPRDDALSTQETTDGDWTLPRANARGALWVELDQTNVVVVDGSAVTQPVSAAALPLPSGAATSAAQLADGHNVTVDNGAAGAAVNVQDGGNSLTVDSADLATIAGAVTGSEMQVDVITSALPSGAATSALQLAAGHTVTPIPATSGGTSFDRLISAASNNATSVKASAGQVYGFQVFNLNASPAYFKLYNKASAPAPATDNGLLVKTIMIPGNANGAGVVAMSGLGWEFGTGIGFALVTGIGDTDNTAVAANEIVVNIDYE